MHKCFSTIFSLFSNGIPFNVPSAKKLQMAAVLSELNLLSQYFLFIEEHLHYVDLITSKMHFERIVIWKKIALGNSQSSPEIQSLTYYFKHARYCGITKNTFIASL